MRNSFEGLQKCCILNIFPEINAYVTFSQMGTALHIWITSETDLLGLCMGHVQ